MRYRLMATYRGAPYEAGVGPADGSVVLFAACPPPEELGFEPATGHWRKELRIQDVQAVWQSRPVGRFRGERCVVLDDLGDRLHICYLGHDAFKAEQLGFWQVDRGVFELIAARDEITDIIEERSDFPGRPGPGQRSDYPSLPPAEDLSYGRPPASQIAPGYLYPAGSAAAAARMLPQPGGNNALPPDGAPPPGNGLLPGSALPGSALPGAGPLAPGNALLPDRSDVSLPPHATEPPLPLEAEAMRAASAAARREQPAPPGSPGGPDAVPTGPAANGPAAIGPASRGLPPNRPAPNRPLQNGAGTAAMNGPVPHSGIPNGTIPNGPVPNGAVPSGPAAPGSVPHGRLRDGGLPDGLGPGGPVPGGAGPTSPASAVPPPAPPLGPHGGPSLQAAPVAAPQAPPDRPVTAQPGMPQPGTPYRGPAIPGQGQPPAARPGTRGSGSGHPGDGLPPGVPFPPIPHGTPGSSVPPGPAAGPGGLAGPDGRSESPRRRRAAGRRMATERLFSELASQAAIPARAYSVGEEVDGAMCLLETPDGFEVFSSAGGARHEIRVFSDEESACFYLFGVLAAEAVRTGALVPSGGRMPAGATPEGALRR